MTVGSDAERLDLTDEWMIRAKISYEIMLGKIGQGSPKFACDLKMQKTINSCLRNVQTCAQNDQLHKKDLWYA